MANIWAQNIYFLLYLDVKNVTGSTLRRRKHSASQTEDDDHVSKTLEFSPEQAFTDIDREFVDRRQQGTSQADTSVPGVLFFFL